MLWGTVLSLIFLLGVFLLIRSFSFFQLPDLPKKYLHLALIVKLLAAGATYLLYTQYYQDRESADIFKYYDDAEIIYQKGDLMLFPDLFRDKNARPNEAIKVLQNTSHWDKGDQLLPNDNRLMISINYLLFYLSGGFYLFHLLFFSCLSFIGCIALLHFFKSLSKLPSALLLAIIILPPSFLLWTSSLLKESLFICFFGLFLYSISKAYRPRSIMLSLMSLFGLLIIKSYLLICFLPALIFYLFSKRIALTRSLTFTLSICLLLLISNWSTLISEMQLFLDRFTQLGIDSNAGSYFPIEIPNAKLGFLLYLPNALYNVWVRPILEIGRGGLFLISGLENLLYLGLIPLIWIFPRKPIKHKWRIFWICISFLLIGSALIGSCIPILGAVLRYRSPLLPFYLLLLFTFVDLSVIYKFNKKS